MSGLPINSVCPVDLLMVNGCVVLLKIVEKSNSLASLVEVVVGRPVK